MTLFYKSIIAGILIGLGVIINTLSEVPVLGAMFFSFGLLTIIELSLPLFTGKVGFYDLSKEKTKSLLIILVGNLFGILMCVFCYSFCNSEFFDIFIPKANAKFERGYFELAAAGVFCGGLIHFAVKAKNYIITILAIMIFILIGAEHCIADFPYLLVTTNPLNWLKFLFVVVGNSLGAIFVENMLKQEGNLL